MNMDLQAGDNIEDTDNGSGTSMEQCTSTSNTAVTHDLPV